jgi:hypothetical protein
MTGGGASAPWVICCRCIRPQCLSMPALPPKGNFDWQLSSRGQSQGCPSVVQSCPLLPCGHRSNGERNPIVDLCLTDLSRQILGVFMRHRIPATGTLQRNYFLKCATVISNAGSTRRSPTIGYHRFAKPLPLSTHDDGIRCRADNPSGPRSVEREQCPLWVKSRHWHRKKSCPLYPRKRTFPTRSCPLWAKGSDLSK